MTIKITYVENRLNNLKIYTDKILGAGSGGTFVFEGKFEVCVEADVLIIAY